MKLKILVTIFAALAKANVYAEEPYNSEIGLQYGNENTDDKTSVKALVLRSTFYLDPIENDPEQPYAERPFLQKTSSILINTGSFNLESAYLESTAVFPIGFGGNFYVNNFAFGALTRSWGETIFDSKLNSSAYIGIKQTHNGFYVGYFVTPTTLVKFANDTASSTYSPSSGSINDLTITTSGLTAKTINSFGSTATFVIDLGYNQIKREQDVSQTNTEYEFNVRYYPKTKYFVEGGYKVNNGDYASAKGNTYNFGAGFKVSSNLDLQLASSKFSVLNAKEKSSSMSTTLSVNFYLNP